MEESPAGFLQSLKAEDSNPGYGSPETYVDDFGQEVCPLTDIACQGIFLNLM